jgi:aliphatic nitrilase
MAAAIRIRATAHSFEGKLFTIVSCSTISEEIIAAMSADRPANRDLLERKNSAFSGIIDPAGNPVGEPLIDDEGIVYGEIDLNSCIQPKQMHDIIGGYNRFDIFDLRIDRRPRGSASFRDE